MATLKLVLDTRRARKDGTFPLVFRIRSADKFCDIASGFTLPQKSFDIKTGSAVKNDEVNNHLEQLREHYNKRFREYLSSNPNSEDLKDLKGYLLNKQPSETTIETFWLDHIQNLKATNRNGGARVYQMSFSTISKEMDLNVSFQKLVYADILALETRLYKRGMTANGISVYMRSFRAICNLAINLELVGNDWYPFRKYKIKKAKTTPRVLSLSEIRDYFDCTKVGVLAN